MFKQTNGNKGDFLFCYYTNPFLSGQEPSPEPVFSFCVGEEGWRWVFTLAALGHPTRVISLVPYTVFILYIVLLFLHILSLLFSLFLLIFLLLLVLFLLFPLLLVLFLLFLFFFLAKFSSF